MKMFGSFVILAVIKLTRQEEESNSIEAGLAASNMSRNKEIKVYWNIPTFQCDSHKLNFSQLAEKYNIVQNKNDRFRGEDIAILYDPGSFPAILKDGSKSILRNGGVPQEGNLNHHLDIFETILNELIPDRDFSGIGIIDFESWRPIFRQNFGILSAYKDLSISIEKQKHPSWSNTRITKEATERFEVNAKKFMENTLSLARDLRPNATWGYYAYPYCFNKSPKNMRMDCPKEAVQENDRTKWLFKLSDNFYPSLYLESSRLTAKDKVEMIEGRINEAVRILEEIDGLNSTKIIPYYWYKYHDTKQFVSKEDLFNTLTALSASVIDGMVLWGSSNDVNTKAKCLALFHYVDDTLGPLLVNNF